MSLENDILSSTKELYQQGSDRIAEVKSHLFRLLPFWIAGSLTAVIATGYAKLFFLAEEQALILFESSGYWFLLIPPSFFVVSWYLVEKFAPYSNGSGIPQLMASVELSHTPQNKMIDHFLNFRIIVIKVLSSVIGVMGGAAIGREGPTLQIAGSIFNIVDKKMSFNDSKNRYGFILAGAASGLASAFNTPLGGIVYVVEELAKSHLSGFRTGVLHAVIFAGLISQLIMGPYLYLGFPKIAQFQFGAIYQFIILALLSGTIAALFGQSLKKIVMFRLNLQSMFRKCLFTIFVGFIFAACAIWLSPNTLGTGKNLISNLLFNNGISSLSDVVARFLGSFLTYSNGGAGGIFAPTLSLGASITSYFNNVFGYNLGAIAVLIGMTSALAALTHSPLTSFILILEMTDRYSSIFPLMIAALIGHGISKLISKKSFYEFVCERLLSSLNKTDELNEPLK